MPQARKRLHQCLDMALDIYELLGRQNMNHFGKLVAVSLDKEEIKAILTKNGSPPLADLRMKYIITFIGNMISVSINDGGDLVLCHVWNLAHSFEHIIWDSELPPL